MDADAQAELDAELRLHPRRMLCEELLHPDRATERALRIVLVGDRRAKDDEDRVANELFDRPVVPECFLGEVFENAGDEHLQLLRIQVLSKRGESDEVREQHRYQSALLVLGLDPSHPLSVAHPRAGRSAWAPRTWRRPCDRGLSYFGKRTRSPLGQA